jgi:hypothetical protein
VVSNAFALEVATLSSIANFDDEFGLANAKDRLGIDNCILQLLRTCCRRPEIAIILLVSVSGKELVSTSMVREDTDATMSVAISNLAARPKELDRLPGACLNFLVIFLSNRSSLTGLAG